MCLIFAENVGRFNALVLHFDLPSSSYATVALRELTKTDMSVTVQSKLGEQHRQEGENCIGHVTDT